jgi:hypothetical protein
MAGRDRHQCGCQGNTFWEAEPQGVVPKRQAPLLLGGLFPTGPLMRHILFQLRSPLSLPIPNSYTYRNILSKSDRDLAIPSLADSVLATLT